MPTHRVFWKTVTTDNPFLSNYYSFYFSTIQRLKSYPGFLRTHTGQVPIPHTSCSTSHALLILCFSNTASKTESNLLHVSCGTTESYSFENFLFQMNRNSNCEYVTLLLLLFPSFLFCFFLLYFPYFRKLKYVCIYGKKQHQNGDHRITMYRPTAFSYQLQTVPYDLKRKTKQQAFGAYAKLRISL